jgi:hypothetical protein
VFSGGTYEECARWLWNFLTSHAKRENYRIEAVVDADGEREGQSYAAWLRLGDQRSPVIELPYKEVAESRGSLAWCAALAARARALARDLTVAARAR